MKNIELNYAHVSCTYPCNISQAQVTITERETESIPAVYVAMRGVILNCYNNYRHILYKFNSITEVPAGLYLTADTQQLSIELNNLILVVRRFFQDKKHESTCHLQVQILVIGLNAFYRSSILLEKNEHIIMCDI
jgi:hypothetical protein